MTKEDVLIDKQVDLFKKALAQTIDDVSEKCIKSDGGVNTKAITVALGSVLGASIASLTSHLPMNDVNRVTSLICDFVKNVCKANRDELENSSSKK